MRVFLCWLLTAGCIWAEGERAGDFDYYVLALSWSPTWCALEGDARNSPQCQDEADFGWVLHGLWPQYEDGWPSYCNTTAGNPNRSQTRARADLYGSSGSAWHQWNKHGRCSGLQAGDYYDLSQIAYDRINRPNVFRRLQKAVRIPALVIEEAFLEENTNLSGDMLTVTCKQGRIQEVRICMDRELEPRTCSGSVSRDCTMNNALLEPIR